MTVQSFDHFPHDPEIEEIANALAGPGWCVRRGFLTPPQRLEMASACRARWREGTFRPARIGTGATRQSRPEIRSDHVSWLEPADWRGATRAYLARLESLRLAVNRRLYLGLFEFEGHFAVYPPGAFYRRHLDQFQGVQYRQVSLILYLNDAWEPDDAGVLRLYLPDGRSRDVAPEGGTLVAFLSATFEHEVLPTRRERLSLTGWLRQRLAPVS